METSKLLGQLVKVEWIDICHADECSEHEARTLEPIHMVSTGTILTADDKVVRLFFTHSVEPDGQRVFRDVLAIPRIVIQKIIELEDKQNAIPVVKKTRA